MTRVINLADLDGSNGFRLDGANDGDESGISVSGLGDINNDGFDDVIVGAHLSGVNGIESGSSYVFYGAAGGFVGNYNLGQLNGSGGHRFDGVEAGGLFGSSVSGTGDVNGDGIPDLIIGAWSSNTNGAQSGAGYVVFGVTGGFPIGLSPADLDGTNGFRIDGESTGDYAGFAVSGAGDFNKDGVDDLLIGAYSATVLNSGAAYVVFGKPAGFPDVLSLADLDGSNGFRLDGEMVADFAGFAVSAAGDLNHDGIDDLAIGAPRSDAAGLQAGAVYIVFGTTSAMPATLDLGSLDGSNGFRLVGAAAGDEAGVSISHAGDINGDGIDDLAIGASLADNNANSAGSVFVLLGSTQGFPATFDLADLNGNNGFRIDGEALFDNLGDAVSGIGDFNGDGLDDLVVGASNHDLAGINAGAAYVIFGSAAFDAVIDLRTLGPETGLRIDGEEDNHNLGIAVSGAGDINGDGFADLIVGARGATFDNGDAAGASYIVFGAPENRAPTGVVSISGPPIQGNTLTATDTLADEDGLGQLTYQWFADGTPIAGATAATLPLTPNLIDSAISVTVSYTDNRGTAESVTSGATLPIIAAAAVIDLSRLDGINGARFDGGLEGDSAGNSISSAGDVNGDGFADLLIGASGADRNGLASGSSYVVLGSASGFPAAVNLDNLDGSNGFRLDGGPGSQSGTSVSTAGDVNGDGFDDVIVGAWQAQPDGRFAAGSSYVVFGKASGFAAATSLENLDAGDGFRLDGAAAGEISGFAVSNAGDVNHDGYDDILIGASRADINGLDSGVAYLVFGKAEGFDPALNLASLDGSSGMRLTGASILDRAGNSVGAAGDVNGDGFADFLVGAFGAKYNGISAGATYLVFGKAEGYTASLNLGSLNGENGFRLDGPAGSGSGVSVNGAGDINGDGFDDIIVGAGFVDAGGIDSGAAFVFFGRSDGFAATLNLATLDGINGFVIGGEAADDQLGFGVSGIGDVNGDGIDDLLVGAYRHDLDGAQPGSAYVIYGTTDAFAASFDLSQLDGSNGFRLYGLTDGDQLGQSVSAAGDVNGDGLDDLLIGAGRAGLSGPQAGSTFLLSGFKSLPQAGSVADGYLAGARLFSDYNGDGQADPEEDTGVITDAAGQFEILPTLLRAPLLATGGSAVDTGLANSLVLSAPTGFSLLNPLTTLVQAVATAGNQSPEQAAATVRTALGLDSSIDLLRYDPLTQDPVDARALDTQRAAVQLAVLVALTGESTTFSDLAGHLLDNPGAALNLTDALILQAWLPSIDSTLLEFAALANGQIALAPTMAAMAQIQAAILDDQNDAPIVLTTPADQQTDQFSQFSFQLATDTFFDFDPGDTADLYATRVDDSALPAWLIFDPVSRTFSGTPGAGDDGQVMIKLVAMDDGNETVTVSFTVTVSPVNPGQLIDGSASADELVGGPGDDTLRGFGGRDTLEGQAGDDRLEGGDDLDHARFQGARSDYVIQNNAGQLAVSGPVADGNDELVSLERLHFTDTSLAFDLGPGESAGNTVKLLGVMLGAAGSTDTLLRGIGIDLFDNAGLSFEQVMNVALDVVLAGERSDTAVINLLWSNLVGGPTPQDLLNDLVAGLQGGAFTQAGLAVLAAEIDINASNIGLVGLLENGMEYLPVI